MENKELWKDIVGWEGLYQISTKKNVRRFFLKSGFQQMNTHPPYNHVMLSDKRNGSVKGIVVNKLYDRAFGGYTRKFIEDNIKRAIPIVAFDMDGNFVGRYGTLNSFIRANYGKDTKFSNIQLRDIRLGTARYKEHYVMTCDDKSLKELQNFRARLVRERKKEAHRLELETKTQNNLKLLSKLNRAILITDGDYNPIETYNDTLTSLAKREKTPVGTFKARMNKDLKVFKRYVKGEITMNLTSTKRYFYMPNYFEVIKTIKV